MSLFGRLGGSMLAVCCVTIVLLCFGAGFVSAVYLGHMDSGTASAVAGTALAKSQLAIRAREGLLSQGQRMARRPVFALSTFAARPVQGAFRRVPGALRPVSPQLALDQALRDQTSRTDTAVSTLTSSAASAVRTDMAAAGKPAGQADAPGAQSAAPGSAPATPPPEVPTRVVVAPPPPGGMFTIELASFLQPDLFKQFVAEMQGRKLPIAVVDETDGSGRDWHHVRLGSFASREQAATRLAELTRDEGLSGVVVPDLPAAPKS